MGYYRLWRPGFLLFVMSFWVHGQATAASLESVTSESEHSARQRTIVVGRVSADPKKTYPRLERLANYLAQRLAPLGITTGDVVIARDNREMIALLRSGKVDISSETALSAMLFSDEAGAEVLLREWKKGVAWYRTVFFARKGSGIASLADLRGKKIAFEDAGSTSGFLLPLAMLRQQGLEVVKLTSPQDDPPAGKVGYAFAKEEVNIAAWVERGLVDAGAFSGGDWEDLSRTPEALKERLEIFHASEPFIRSLVLARSGMRPEVKARLVDILLGMDTDPQGSDVLKAYYRVKKYDRIEGEVADGLERARRVFALVRNEID